MTTLAELKAALDAQARDIPPAEEVLARARTRRAPGHRGLLLAAAAVVALVAGVLVVVLRGGSSSTPPADRTTWKTYHSALFGLSVRYPSTWHATYYEEVSTMTAAVVFLGDQPMHEPCTSVANGDNCGPVVDHIAPGGVAISWFNDGFLGRPTLASYPGQATTIGGYPARLAIGTDPECVRIGGTTSVTATVQRRASGNFFTMGACVAAPRDSAQVKLVLQSLRSMRQSG